MKFTIILVVITCVLWKTDAFPQDSEPRSQPPRGLLKRGLLAKGKTTTTTTPPPLEEEEYVDESEYPEDAAEEPSTEAPPSSTEGKKLVSGGVRPFRSNADLLETLKRRRAEAAEAKLHGHPSAAVRDEPATEAPVKAKSQDKKRFSASKDSITEETGPAKPSRSRFGRPASRSIPEPEKEEQSNDAAPTVRSGRTFRRGGF